MNELVSESFRISFIILTIFSFAVIIMTTIIYLFFLSIVLLIMTIIFTVFFMIAVFIVFFMTAVFTVFFMITVFTVFFVTTVFTIYSVTAIFIILIYFFFFFFFSIISVCNHNSAIKFHQKVKKMKKIFNQFFIWKINKISRQAIKQKLTKMKLIVNAQMWSMNDLKDMTDSTSANYWTAIQVKMLNEMTCVFKKDLKLFKLT